MIVVLITGALTGIGRATALAFAKDKRAATPQEIADTILFLACKAPFLTGQSIVVDGGKTAG